MAEDNSTASERSPTTDTAAATQSEGGGPGEKGRPNALRIAARVNPLALVQTLVGLPVDHAALLGFLCPDTREGLSAAQQRFEALSRHDPRLAIVPAEPTIDRNLITPLVQAKGAFLIGHFEGTIALCGMVAEKVAIFWFDITEACCGLDEKAQKGLLGSKFDKLSQDRRVQVLRALNVIDDEVVQRFTTLRTTRSRYLHFLSDDRSDQLKTDAETVSTSPATAS